MHTNKRRPPSDFGSRYYTVGMYRRRLQKQSAAYNFGTWYVKAIVKLPEVSKLSQAKGTSLQFFAALPHDRADPCSKLYPMPRLQRRPVSSKSHPTKIHAEQFSTVLLDELRCTPCELMLCVPSTELPSAEPLMGRVESAAICASWSSNIINLDRKVWEAADSLAVHPMGSY